MYVKGRLCPSLEKLHMPDKPEKCPFCDEDISVNGIMVSHERSPPCLVNEILALRAENARLVGENVRLRLALSGNNVAEKLVTSNATGANAGAPSTAPNPTNNEKAT